MDEAGFKKYLKQKGKKSNVIDRNVESVKFFASFLQRERGKELAYTTKEDIESYVDMIEEQKKSAKGALYTLMNYFRFIENKELLTHASALRAERTKKTKRIFPIKEFLKVDQDAVKKLATIGIKNVEEMLEKGKTKKQREELAKQLEIPEESILELVKLSDITRIGYVKQKLSRLYYEAGLDSPVKIAAFDPKDLHAFFVKFVEESGWDGMVPNPGDLVGNVANAKKLKKVVEE